MGKEEREGEDGEEREVVVAREFDDLWRALSQEKGGERERESAREK